MTRFQTAARGEDVSEHPGYELLGRKLKQLTGIDLSAYKSRQMIRRLTGYLKRIDVADFFALARLIEQDEEALQHLKDFLMINVSEFFRNPERYEVLEKELLPELRKRSGRLTIWSAGCSIGAEPYSVAILLAEQPDGLRHQVLGTDIDAKALRVARAGIYSEDKLREVSEARRRRFFQRTEDGQWKINEEIQKQVEFRQHDLLSDPYPQGVHLILCRNVVIYFTDTAKERIYQRFAEALVPGGYLMIGSTESIFNPGNYGLRTAGPFLYQKETG